jgi:predicted TIM-barrel fold metal-dependent hydrolase
MTDAVIREIAMKEADQAFSKQVTNQVARVTGELNRLEQLLSAGMVDRRVLSEFRYAVDRARKTGWQVEKWLGGESRELSAMITEERIHCITRLATHLASELQAEEKSYAGVDAMREAMQKLDIALKSV